MKNNSVNENQELNSQPLECPRPAPESRRITILEHTGLLHDILSNYSRTFWDDDVSDEDYGHGIAAVDSMEPDELFNRWLEWQGIIGYAGSVISALKVIRVATGVDLTQPSAEFVKSWERALPKTQDGNTAVSAGATAQDGV